MRWDRLFDELERGSLDQELLERDQLADDLRDEAWAGTSWLDLLGGDVVLEVVGVGQVAGTVRLAGEQVISLVRAEGDVFVAAGAVTAVLSTQQRATPATDVARRLSWGPALRALREERLPLRVVRRDAAVHEADHVEAVGRDFVTLALSASRTVVVPWQALAQVSVRG